MSLDNSYDRNDLLDFDRRVRKGLEEEGLSPDTPVEYVLEPKIDGLSVVLQYEDGKLIQEYACYNGSYEHKLTLTYNDNGNLVSMSRYSDGELVSEITLTYESVTVSKDIAKKIEKLISILGML